MDDAILMKRNKTLMTAPTMSTEIYEIFMIYYALGDNRSLAAVADKASVPMGTISEWSTKYKWGLHVENLDKKANAEIEKQMINKIVKSRLKYYMILDRAILSTINPRTGKLKFSIKNMGDLDKAVRASMLMLGDVTDRTEHTAPASLREAIEKLQAAKSGRSYSEE